MTERGRWTEPRQAQPAPAPAPPINLAAATRTDGAAASPTDDAERPRGSGTVSGGGGHGDQRDVHRRVRSRGQNSDPLAVFTATPTRSSKPPPPPSLGLPPLPRRAAKLTRRRTHFVSVADTLQPGESVPTTVAGYVTKVAQILAHRTYYFPDAAGQYAAYIAWLLERSQNCSLACVATLDAQARTQMAQTPDIYLTPTALQHFVLAADAGARPAATGQRPLGFGMIRGGQGRKAEVCGLHNAFRCSPGLCPRRRRHVCSQCESPAHRRGDCPQAATHRNGL